MPQQTLYIGSYATPDQPGIYAFTFDDVTGALAAQGSPRRGRQPVLHRPPPQRPVVIRGERDRPEQDGVPARSGRSRLAREPWAITPINQQASGGDWPCHLALDATGRWLLVATTPRAASACCPSGRMARWARWPTCRQHQGQRAAPGAADRPARPLDHFTPDQRFVIAGRPGHRCAGGVPLRRRRGGWWRGARSPPGPAPGRGIWPSIRTASTYTWRTSWTTPWPSTITTAAAGGCVSEQIVETLPPDAPENTVADIHITPGGGAGLRLESRA